MCGKFLLDCNLTRTMGSLNEHMGMFMMKYPRIHLRKGTFPNKFVDKLKKIVFNNFFPKYSYFFQKM
jgi:hypothetical protein